MEIQECVQLFLEYMKYTIPFSVVFGFGTKLVNMIMTSAFTGKIKF